MELPPCVKMAVSLRDKEALDEIFSFLHSYADDATRDAVLWSIGYYDLATYSQRKLTAEAQINSAPFFVCNFLKKPDYLSKYCTQEDEQACPLRDSLQKLQMLIDVVYLLPHKFSAATLEVRLKDGTVFVRRNASFAPLMASQFWLRSAELFLRWFSETHKDKGFPDFIDVPVKAVAEVFSNSAVVVRSNDGGVAPLHPQDAK